MKCASDCSPTKSDLTLAGFSLQCLRWSVPQMCIRTVACSNQQLHLFSQFSLIILIMPHPTPIRIKHEVLALAGEGMWQSAVAGCMGVTHDVVNRILQRHAATRTLVPGKSMGAPQKTTPRYDHALLRMVRQDPFLSAQALTAQIKNLYGMRAGWTTVNNRLLSRGYWAYRHTRKHLLIDNRRRLCLALAQRW